MLLFIFLVVISLTSSFRELTIPVYDSFSSNLVSFPAPPKCHTNFNSTLTNTTYIQIHTLDTTKLISIGIVYWSKRMQTSCYTNFVGNQDKTVLKSYLISSVPNLEVINKYLSDLHMYETTDSNPDSLYNCKWLSTSTKISLRSYYKKVQIYYNTDGTLYSNNMDWEWESNLQVWKNGFYYLHTSYSPESRCPHFITQSYQAIIATHLNYYFFTVPKLQIQFNLPIINSTILCNNTNGPVYITPEKYLISTTIYKGTTQKANNLHLNTNYQTSRTLYNLNKLELLIEKDLNYIEREVCISKAFLWKLMFSSKNPDLIAQYHTGSPWSFGQFYNQKILIKTPLLSNLTCILPNERLIEKYKVKILCRHYLANSSVILKSVFIDPWTNCINCNNTFHEYGYWIQTSNHSYMNYITDHVLANDDIIHHTLDRFRENSYNDSLNYKQSVIRDNNDDEEDIISPLNYTEYPIFLTIIEFLNSIKIYISGIIVTILCIYIAIYILKYCLKRSTQSKLHPSLI